MKYGVRGSEADGVERPPEHEPRTRSDKPNNHGTDQRKHKPRLPDTPYNHRAHGFGKVDSLDGTILRGETADDLYVAVEDGKESNCEDRPYDYVQNDALPED